MAAPVRELGYGDVEVYSEETLGVGSYGKVCKAKCGQLPCAAKLLHDTMFGTNDYGISRFVEQFEQDMLLSEANKTSKHRQVSGHCERPSVTKAGSPDGADG